jgi:hypothetical protein
VLSPLKATIKALLSHLGYQLLPLAQFEESRRAYDRAVKQLDEYRSAYEKTLLERDEFKTAFEREVCEKTRTVATPQVAFMHIMKTAGISVQMFLKPFIADSRNLWVESSEQIEPLHPHYVEYFDLVQGHFSYKDTTKLRANKRLISILREPVDRVLSAYWYFRTRKDEEVRDITRHMIAYAKKCTFLEWLRCDHPQVQSVTHNQQTFAFAHDWRAPRGQSDDKVLQEALCHLDEFYFVGFFERLQESMQLLSKSMGWAPHEALGRHNVTPQRQSVRDLSAQERDAVIELNQYDYVLYNRVRQQLEDKLGPVAR